MTTLAQRLSDYASTLQPRDLPAEVTKYAKRLIIDTIGCAIGAYTSEPSKIAVTSPRRSAAAGCARP